MIERNRILGFALLVLLAVGLRTVEAGRKSIWLDEFHTLEVAAAGDMSGIVEKLRPDFHAPVFFTLVHFAGDHDPHGLRILPILFSLLGLLPLLGILRAARLTGWGMAAALVTWAALPFQIQYGAELRPYSLLELLSLCMVWAAFTSKASSRTRSVVFFSAVTLGLYTHYLAAVIVVAIGIARLVVRRPEWLPLRRILLVGTVGVIMFLPWAISVEGWFFTDPGVLLRNEKSGLSEGPALNQVSHDLLPEVVSLLPRTLAPTLVTLGQTSEDVVTAALICLGLVVLLALGWRIRSRGTGAPLENTGVISGTVLAGCMALTITLLLCIGFWDRVPIQYFVVGAWAWPIVFGAAVDALGKSRWRSRAALITIVATITCGTGHVMGNSREDVRAGVAAALELGKDRNALYTAVLHQPLYYSHLIPYEVYAPDVDLLEPGSHLLVEGEAAQRPVVVLVRNMRIKPKDQLWVNIASGRRQEGAIRRIDPTISVIMFVPE